MPRSSSPGRVTAGIMAGSTPAATAGVTDGVTDGAETFAALTVSRAAVFSIVSVEATPAGEGAAGRGGTTGGNGRARFAAVRVSIPGTSRDAALRNTAPRGTMLRAGEAGPRLMRRAVARDLTRRADTSGIASTWRRLAESSGRPATSDAVSSVSAAFLAGTPRNSSIVVSARPQKAVAATLNERRVFADSLLPYVH